MNSDQCYRFWLWSAPFCLAFLPCWVYLGVLRAHHFDKVSRSYWLTPLVLALICPVGVLMVVRGSWSDNAVLVGDVVTVIGVLFGSILLFFGIVCYTSRDPRDAFQRIWEDSTLSGARWDLEDAFHCSGWAKCREAIAVFNRRWTLSVLNLGAVIMAVSVGCTVHHWWWVRCRTRRPAPDSARLLASGAVSGAYVSEPGGVTVAPASPAPT